MRLTFKHRLAATASLAGVAAALFLAQPQLIVHASREQKQQGATLYHQTGCEHCHGADLRGGELGPNLSTIGKQWTKPQIEHQIVHGGGGMPSFADTLQPDEIAALVEFLHAQRKPPKTARQPAASATQP